MTSRYRGCGKRLLCRRKDQLHQKSIHSSNLTQFSLKIKKTVKITAGTPSPYQNPPPSCPPPANKAQGTRGDFRRVTKHCCGEVIGRRGQRAGRGARGIGGRGSKLPKSPKKSKKKNHRIRSPRRSPKILRRIKMKMRMKWYRRQNSYTRIS